MTDELETKPARGHKFLHSDRAKSFEPGEPQAGTDQGNACRQLRGKSRFSPNSLNAQLNNARPQRLPPVRLGNVQTIRCGGRCVTALASSLALLAVRFRRQWAGFRY